MSNDKRPGIGFGVMLTKGDKVLLGLRHEDPEKADTVFQETATWTMPGGKLDYGERLKDGAVREVKEETGIVVNSIDIICINDDMNEHAHFVTVGMYSDDFEGEPQVLEPDEITEWRWFGPDELPENIYFPSAHVLENYQKGEFYIPR